MTAPITMSAKTSPEETRLPLRIGAYLSKDKSLSQ
jgi:hypothetical protein